MSNDANSGTKVNRLPSALPGLPFARQPGLRQISDIAPIELAFLSPDCRYLYINQRLSEICGISVEEHLGRTVRECVPALANSVEAIVASAVVTGEPAIGIEIVEQRSNHAKDRTWITYWHALRGPDGDIVGINVVAKEVNERKRMEAALQRSEQQFYTLADSIPQLVWMANADGRIFWVNEQWCEYTGAVEGSGPRDWQELLAPASRMEVSMRWAKSLRAGTALEMELSLLGRTGQYRPFLTRVVPLRDAASRVYRWIGTHIDIAEQKRREEHTAFIIRELSHRTKNLLAVVLAIAKQTAQHTSDVDQYYARFVRRLQALAHCQDLLVKDNWQGASFHDLVLVQMNPFEEANAPRIDAAGPPIVLKPDAVQHLGLALHELATNASKYGALSDPNGGVVNRWNDHNDKVQFSWHEKGGPPVTSPQRRGFGRVVIEEIVPRALNGAGTLEFCSSGVSWTFEFLQRASD